MLYSPETITKLHVYALRFFFFFLKFLESEMLKFISTVQMYTQLIIEKKNLIIFYFTSELLFLQFLQMPDAN